mgnify:CR=1 FL=1
MKDISKSDLTNNIPLAALKEGESTKPVTIAGVEFGGSDFTIIAGPCTVESEEQIVEIAGEVKKRGAKMLRGGAFKPLSFPYRSDSFFELGEIGLEYLNTARETHKIPFMFVLVVSRISALSKNDIYL